MRSLMRALVAFLMVVSSYVPSFGVPLPASAAGCQFVLGFSTLHDLIPDSVGDCKVDQHYNPQNGDALQETARGLLVWRKADNFTAFTDGFNSWVIGPYGLQQRLNTERFDWEGQSQSQAKAEACEVSDKDVTFSKFVGDADGSAVGQGKVQNPCSYPLDAIIDVFARASKDGPVIMDAPSVFIKELAPGDARSFSVRVPSGFAATWFTWKLTDVSVQTLASSEDCSGPRTGTCLYADRWLVSALNEIEGVDEGEWLLTAAAENKVHIRRGQTEAGILGRYSAATKTLTIDVKLDTYSSWVRAAVMAHELQHAVDDASGLWPQSSTDCYRAEESAFHRQAKVWRALWQNQLPSGIVDEIHWELNQIALSIERDSAAFARSLLPHYNKQCGA